MTVKLTKEDFSVVDLFCGVGGLTRGFINRGFTVSAGLDVDDTCQYAYETNNDVPFIQNDIRYLSAFGLNNLFKPYKKRILVGCAPCQPFSIYNFKNRQNPNEHDPNQKWELLKYFARLIVETKPEIISMENVPLLVNFNGGKVFKEFVNSLEESGYNISYKCIDAQDYGVPQRRKRLILFGTLLSERIEILPTNIISGNYKTVEEAIGDLPPIEDGVAHPNDPLHYARKLTEMNKRRIKTTKEGGSWSDWDEELKLNCHKKPSGSGFLSVYGRMKWNDVAPTMTTHCIGLSNGRFGHPSQDRAISLREAALFQTFPKDYKFYDSNKQPIIADIAKHIGNAVPVRLGEVIAESIENYLNQLKYVSN